MQTDELDYSLPQDRIATTPAEPRDHSRLLAYDRTSASLQHLHFFDLPSLLRPGDLLVVNNSRVIPAKLELHKTTGAFIPGLFLEDTGNGVWRVMLRSRGKVKTGDILQTKGPHPTEIEILSRGGEEGQWLVRPRDPRPYRAVLADIGHTPLPPYIEKMRTNAPDESFDRSHYQTVYAQSESENAATGPSLAAPTAGLHFTPELLARLASLGVRLANVELEVGLGTFLPIETPTLETHPMHIERYHIPPETITALRNQLSSGAGGGRIIPVGTTAVRTLESAAPAILNPQPSSPASPVASASLPMLGKCNPHSPSTPPAQKDPALTSISSPSAISGQTNLLISPGYSFQLTDALITNFHLPRSTLIALVAAFIGLPTVKSLYAQAIAANYRFYSYGDAMLLT